VWLVTFDLQGSINEVELRKLVDGIVCYMSNWIWIESLCIHDWLKLQTWSYCISNIRILQLIIRYNLKMMQLLSGTIWK